MAIHNQQAILPFLCFGHRGLVESLNEPDTELIIDSAVVGVVIYLSPLLSVVYQLDWCCMPFQIINGRLSIGVDDGYRIAVQSSAKL